MLDQGQKDEYSIFVQCKSHKKTYKETKTLWYKLNRAMVPVPSSHSLQRQLEVKSLQNFTKNISHFLFRIWKLIFPFVSSSTLQEDSSKTSWQRTLCLQNINFFLHLHTCHSIYSPIIRFLTVLVLPVLPGCPLELPSDAGHWTGHSNWLSQSLQQFNQTLPFGSPLLSRKWSAILIDDTFRMKTWSLLSWAITGQHWIFP